MSKQLQEYAPNDIVRESTLKKILEDAIDSTLELDTDELVAHMAVAESSEVTESTDDDAEIETTLKELKSIENVYLQPIPEFEIHRKRDLYKMTYPQLLEVAAYRP